MKERGGENKREKETHRIPQTESLVQVGNHIDAVQEPFRRRLGLRPLARVHIGRVRVRRELVEVRFDGNAQSAVMIIDKGQAKYGCYYLFINFFFAQKHLQRRNNRKRGNMEQKM
jgi:hypothetical protein